LFLPFSAYPKPRTAFLEEREDDEDLSMEYDDSTCLSWKEILSLTNNNDKVCDLSRYRQREVREDGNRETSGDQVCMSTSM
jgi:hypothetical protein